MNTKQADLYARELMNESLVKLRELQQRGVHVPSEVHFHLGMLHGGIRNVLHAVAITHEREIARLQNTINKYNQNTGKPG